MYPQAGLNANRDFASLGAAEKERGRLVRPNKSGLLAPGAFAQANSLFGKRVLLKAIVAEDGIGLSFVGSCGRDVRAPIGAFNCAR